MTATITRINGHDAQHQLEHFRQAKAQYASALYLALQYLEIANKLAAVNALPYQPPRDREVAEALDIVNRDLNGPPPQAA